MRVRAVVVSFLLLSGGGWALAQGTEFTYQGRLTDAAAPADGSFDFEFRLFDVPTGGAPLATVQRPGVAVAGGLFTAPLDFGGQFTGAPRYLEVAVQPAGGGGYTTLLPRQALTATPYAVRSLQAGTANALGAGCVACVADAQIAGLAGNKITGQVPLAAVPPGSPSYIQNSPSLQAASEFHISGNGTADGTLSGDAVNAATQYRIGGSRVLAVGGSQNVFLGLNAGPQNTSGFGNAFVGHFAGSVNTTGANNSFFGTDSGRNNTATGNSFFGRSAGFDTTTGAANAFFGLDSGRFNTTGGSNAFYGHASGYNNVSGQQNTFMGRLAGSANTTGSNNTYVGFTAGGAAGITNATAIGAGAQATASNTLVLGTSAVGVQVPGSLITAGTFTAAAVDAATQFNIGGSRVLSTAGGGNLFAGVGAGAANTGSQNAFFGARAGEANTTGNGNAFFGTDAGLANTTAVNNSFFGHLAGSAVTTGGGNAFFGAGAGLNDTSGFNNSFFGANAGVQTTLGDYNAFFGFGAGVANTTGTRNSFFGALAGFSNKATGNAFFGYEAGVLNDDGSENAFFGYQAGRQNTTGDWNTFLGREAGRANTTGAANTFVGRWAGHANTTGSGNTYVGFQAGQAATGHNNTFVGTNAGLGTTTGFFNTFVGHQAGQSTGAGIGNSFFGYLAGEATTTGDRNTFLGQEGGRANVTGNNNTTLGWGANVGFDDLTFATAIGSGVVVSTSNTVRLGRLSDRVVVSGDLSVDDDLSVLGTITFVSLGSAGSLDLCRNASNQISSCSSSLRYKEDVQPFTPGLDVVRRLRPISFTWREGGARDVGFAAEEVAEVEPLLALYDGQGQVEGVKYRQLTTVLVNALVEQQAQLARQDEAIRELRSLVQELAAAASGGR